MEEARCRHHPGEYTLDCLDVDTLFKNPERAIGEDKSDVDTNQRTAPSKNKPHETANRAVLFHAIAIVDPDEREVLHIVKNFEQRDPSKNVGHAIIAVPP